MEMKGGDVIVRRTIIAAILPIVLFFLSVIIDYIRLEVAKRRGKKMVWPQEARVAEVLILLLAVSLIIETIFRF